MPSNRAFMSSIAGGPGSLDIRPEMRHTKIIAVEEHIAFPQLLQGLAVENHATKILGSRMTQLSASYAGSRVICPSEPRLQDMNENGIHVQILGYSSTINSTHLNKNGDAAGLDLARKINDELKKSIDTSPARLKAFAELPVHMPLEATKELHRCVSELGFVGAMLSGSVSGEGIFLDDPKFSPLLSAFEELDVPIFLHPGVPPKPVWDSYYHIPDKPEVSTRFGLGGWGWHNEVAIHVLRLVLSGTLDRHPRLKIIIGHQGEMLPSMMQRLEKVFDTATSGLERSVGETLRKQVWISISGFFSLPLTQLTIANWGVDRILFGVDYPYTNMNRVGEFLRALGELVSPHDLQKICQKNAEELFKISI